MGFNSGLKWLMNRLVHYRSTVIGILYTMKCTAVIHPFSDFDEPEQVSEDSSKDTNWRTEESLFDF
jgi:hypothetical protein